MSERYALHRWSSIAARNTHGGEIVPSPLSPEGLAHALANLAAEETADLAFVIARLDVDDHANLCQAIGTANEATIEPRLCLAVDCVSLEAIDFNAIDSQRVGLMLDDVDADTPLSAIASGPIEAIRFRGEFVARASQSLRLGCVLESMLLLAHNLGLSTMGPFEEARPDAMSPPAPRFDYVPSLEAMPPAPRSLVPTIALHRPAQPMSSRRRPGKGTARSLR